jgi:hypothetical protein
MGLENRLDEYRQGLNAAMAAAGAGTGTQDYLRGRSDGLAQAIALLDQLFGRQYDQESKARPEGPASIRRPIEEE